MAEVIDPRKYTVVELVEQFGFTREEALLLKERTSGLSDAFALDDDGNEVHDDIP